MTVMVASETQRRQARIGWFVAVVALLGLTAFLMRGWLMGGLPTSSRREALTELTIVWMFKQELLQGRLLSEWNALWFSGFPWLRFLAYPLYYMVAAVSAWSDIPLAAAMVAFFFAALAGSGLAMFGYLNHILDDWRAALVGAVIYEAFPYHNHVGVETWIHAAFWVLLPLSLWFIELARAKGYQRAHYLILTGVALGCFPVLSSEYALLAGPFVVLYLTLSEWRDVRHKARRFWAALGGYALVGLVALGVACFFVLPALFEVRYVGIYAKHGAGTTFTDHLVREYSVTPALVWYAIARRLHLPTDSVGLPGIVQSFWSVAWYPGVVTTALAALGLGGLRRHFAARAASVCLVLSALLATGPTNPLNFFTHIPVIGRLSPFRGLLLVAMFAATLAAFGVRWLLRAKRLVWLSWVSWAILLALVVADYAPSASAYQTTEAYFSADEREAYTWLSRQQKPGRLWEVSTLPRDLYLRTFTLSLCSRPRYMGYYDNGAPLYTWQQTTWTDLRTALHLHTVRYVLLHVGEAESDRVAPLIGDAGYQMAFASGNVQIWENPQVEGYTRFYSQAALDLTQDFHHPFVALPGFVWRHIAMVTPSLSSLDEQDPITLKEFKYMLVDDAAARVTVSPDRLQNATGRLVIDTEVATLDPAPEVQVSARIERLPFKAIQIDLQAPTKGILSLSESWYPHWRVRVDGQPRPILRVNWAQMGVWLEPGQHHVEFYYQRPWYVLVGYGVTTAFVLGLIVWWTWYGGYALNRPQRILWPDLSDRSSETPITSIQKDA